MPLPRRRPAALAGLLLATVAALGVPARAPAAETGDRGAWTLYAGRMSGERAWEDIVSGPTNVKWTENTYLVVGAYARRLPWTLGGFDWEWEGQVARYFGDQDHWEFNSPVIARWTRFPWRERVATSAAFGLGLSYASELPPVEVELEGSTERLLVYWVMELTAGPPRADWAVSLRLHHRSVAFGLMGEEGGMNAVALGLRRRF